MPRAGFSPDELGTVDISISANARGIFLAVPESRRDIAEERFDSEPILPGSPEMQGIARGSSLAFFPAPPLMAAAAIAAPAIVAVSAPVAHHVHKLYGLAMADSERTVASARAVLEPLAAATRLERMLESQLIADLDRIAPGRGLGTAPRGTATTILEISVLEPALRGPERINANVGLCVHVRVRVLDATTKLECHYDYLEYAGKRRAFPEWAANNGEIFVAEVIGCTRVLSAEIVGQIFGHPGEVASDAQLASASLYRRTRDDNRRRTITPRVYVPPARERYAAR